MDRPREVDGVADRGHLPGPSGPLEHVRENPDHRRLLEEWLRSYRPDELFDTSGRLTERLSELIPEGDRRMVRTPYANGGRILRPLELPDFRSYALNVKAPVASRPNLPASWASFSGTRSSSTRRPSRFFCPDETNSNRLNAVFEVTERASVAPTVSIDDHVGPNGRVMEVLSEHCCQGWLEGYLLTGRHGAWSHTRPLRRSWTRC
jgi:xylulose-5-phosphate/fructose-6-phosphate phosphoketolase